MFSIVMAALAVPLLELARLGVLQGTAEKAPDRHVLSLGWPELERVLPDRGLPRGVIEIASPVEKSVMRGGATTIALSAVRAVHAADPKAWCAWVSEKNAPSLYAPAVAAAGVDLDRLLVVRPEAAALARTVVKVGASGAFDLVVIDALSGLDGKIGKAKTDGAIVIRKLALAAEEKGTTFLVLSNVFASRAAPWPVALRIEVERRPEAIALRVTKDRRGRASSQHVVRLAC
ncbi:MAG: recombinase A [Labilithrix sp.]|nr:recombinase A [Labilithrix sp.]